MQAEQQVLIINQQKLVQAAQALEAREPLLALILLHCVDQLEDVRVKLLQVMEQGASSLIQPAFLELFMQEEIWAQLLSYEPLSQWNVECHFAPRS